MNDCEIDAGQSLEQRDFFLNQEVRSLTLKSFVRLLLDDNDNVSWLDTWVLVCLAMEHVLLVVRCALVNLSLYDFLLLDNFLSIAGLALVFLVNHFALTATVIAGPLRLAIHPRTDHSHLHNLTTTLAGSALLDSAFFATFAFTLSANTFTIDSYFGTLAAVNFFKSHFQRVLNGLHFFRTLLSLTPSHAEHLTQDIVHAMSLASTAFLKTIDTVFVINISLFFVCEYLVGGLQLLEFLNVTTTIGMMLKCQFSKGFLDFIEGCFLINAEQIVVCLVVYLLRGASLTGSTHSSHILKTPKRESASAKKHFDKFKMKTQFHPYLRQH